MIKHEKTIAACVVTYNRKDKLVKCLHALLNQTYSDFQIIVVDNASTDGTKDAIQEFIQNNQIRYYNTGKNLGGAGGFNFAIKKVANKFSYLWIMDDDTYPNNDSLEEFVVHINTLDNEFGYLTSLVEWSDGSACLMNIQTLHDKPFSKIKFLENGLIPVKSASFVSLFIKSDVVKKVGLPIKEFFLWGDDTEYTQRLNSYGGYIVTSSVVLHDMENNDGIDILNSDYNRIQRYTLFIRNRIYIAKSSENKSKIIRAYLSPFKQCVRVLFKAKDNKFGRIRIIVKGLLQGIIFSPEIEYLEDI